MAAWMIPAFICLSLALVVVTMQLLKELFPNLSDDWTIGLSIFPPLAASVVFAVVMFPIHVTAGFDDRWLIFGLRNVEFAEEFYECNRRNARVGEE